MQCSQRAERKNIDKIPQNQSPAVDKLNEPGSRFARILAISRPIGKNVAGFAALTGANSLIHRERWFGFAPAFPDV
jgi:hypothetical protein